MPDKRCPQCEEVKDTSMFYRNRSYTDGCSSYCKVCQNKRTAEYARKNRSKIADKDYQLRQRYGITRSKYDEMLASQRGLCAICGNDGCPTGRRMSVDHDHDTGQVRGLLCSNCNTGIGKLGDSVERLQSAIEYLKKHV